ncbi:MAG: dephospho-CoA kinase [Azospirillaceae bacterium]|nr:dephospho-CoA kinase [Azospirillaceae bacterium]
MVIVGLTGSIGMGKTTAAMMLQRMGVPIHSSDAAVHRLLGPGGAAVGPVGRAFPGVVHDGAVDRRALAERVFGRPDALRRLEAIVHPLVRAAQNRFLACAATHHARIVVLDIPLLFETGADRRVDATICVTAPVFLQRQRVLARPGMTVTRLEAIRQAQMADATKRRRADFVVQTGSGRAFTRRRLRAVIRHLRLCHGRHWPLPGYLSPGPGMKGMES